MNWIRGFITAFCTSGVCFGALFMLSPTGKSERSVRYVLSLCFLVIIIGVAGVNIKKAELSFDFGMEETADITYTEIDTAKYVFAIALQKADINYKEIYIFKDNTQANDISCNKVKIITDCDRERVVAALGGEIEGFEVEVVNE